MSIITSPLLLGADSGIYQISRSLRFNSADSAYLNRTPGSASNRRTFTWAAWVKRSELGTDQNLFYAASNSTDTSHIRFDSDNTLHVFEYTTGFVWRLQTTQVFRDASAWYHIVVAVDTTQATASNRVKIYVNGAQITVFSTASYPSQNADTEFNNTVGHAIGRNDQNGSNYLGAYLADIFWIDGQQLDPSSFTTTDLTTGQLVPKAFTGSYGSNGFKLSFSDNSTTAALGTDTSGNGNTWTANNFSVTAGSGNDSLVDTPTSYGIDDYLGGTVRGNYCTWNEIDRRSTGLLSNGNLKWVASSSGGGYCNIRGTQALIGKVYFEAVVNTKNTAVGIGVAPGADYLKSIGDSSPSDYFGSSSWGSSSAIIYAGFETCYSNGSTTASFSTVSVGSILMCAFDQATGKVWFGINGTWLYSGNPSTGSNPTFTLPTTLQLYPASTLRDSDSIDVNFGQRAWAYTAPTNFKALVDTNLPTPVVAKPSTLMDVVAYAGTNSNPRTFSGLGFSPDLVWTKCRSTSFQHQIFDTVRGANQVLHSNSTENEVANYAYGYISAFTSDGWTVSSGSSSAENHNRSGDSYVAWAWDAGTSTVTNTAGSISSQVRANASAGFSVVSYTGTGSNATVGHGLGVAPQMLIVKSRSNAENWGVYHQSVGNTAFLKLDTTGGSASFNAWASTTPTSTVFSVGNIGETNTNGGTYVCYAFSPVSGYSSMGSYVGNGSSDGPFVYTGFRPRWIIQKASNSGSYGHWLLHDTSRSPDNLADESLYANLSNAEDSSRSIDILSNGFKLRNTAVGGPNVSGDTYIYYAVAESPFQYARAR